MKDSKYLYLQMYATILFIFCLIINIILVYNQILENNNQKTIIKKEDIPLIITINKSIVLCLLFIFLYISYKNYDETIKSKLEITAAFLTFISGLIILYSVINLNDTYEVIYKDENTPIIRRNLNDTSLENPID